MPNKLTLACSKKSIAFIFDEAYSVLRLSLEKPCYNSYPPKAFWQDRGDDLSISLEFTGGLHSSRPSQATGITLINNSALTKAQKNPGLIQAGALII
jgi:hypothetical protein